MIALTLAALWIPPAVAQRTPPPGTGTYHGCSDPTEEGLDIARSVVGKWDAQAYDFRQFSYARPITAEAPPEVHALCDVIRTEAPPEHHYRRLSFFDAGTHYLFVTHPFDPDPSDNTLSFGIRSVGVYDRSGGYITAVSF